MTVSRLSPRLVGACCVGALAVGALAACGSDNSTVSPRATGPRCDYPSAADPGDRKPGPPPAVPTQTSGTATVTMVTSAGTVAWRVDAARTPCTLNSFRHLAEAKFLDGTPCHRVTTGGIFVLQCGDPTGLGTGGPGYTIADEALDGATYPAGTIAMANTGRPGSGGSQFFLNYGDSPLPPTYTPWGTVTQGLDVLKAIGAAGAAGGAADGKPVIPVTVQTFRVSRA